MEKRIYNDNFEQFLKETVDDFRMYPSRKVWHSIYNDIHPSRKWPSLAVLLLLVSSLMFIGVNNTNKGTAIAENQNNNPANPFILEVMPSGKAIPASNLANSNAKKVRSANQFNANERYYRSGNVNSVAGNNPLSFVLGNLTAPDEKEELDLHLTGHVGERELRAREEKAGKLASLLAMTNNKDAIKDEEPVKELELVMDDETEEGANSGKKKKKKGTFAYQFYATPSVGFRSLSKNTDYEPVNPSASLLASTEAEEPALSHSSAVNIETGANVLYKLSGFMRIKAGIQVNYTNYHINAYPLHHPSVTNLLISNPQPVLAARMTTLSTQPNSGAVQNLNNNTYQFSMPVGADFKLAGNSRMQWFAGATIQPTFITGGNAFLISADRKNYVSDPTMLRRFNMNGGIETFISYKVGSGVTLNAGPQLRYQLLSSYDDQYTYDEKLYNIGLKLGVTTSF